MNNEIKRIKKIKKKIIMKFPPGLPVPNDNEILYIPSGLPDLEEVPVIEKDQEKEISIDFFEIPEKNNEKNQEKEISIDFFEIPEKSTEKNNEKNSEEVPVNLLEETIDSDDSSIIEYTTFDYESDNEIGAKEQFYLKAQQKRRMDSENKRSNKNVYSSGILPFYVKNKTIYFLLGKDPEGKWSDFGGRSEVQDNGRWDSTAAREFYEETIGSVLDIQTIMTKLQNQKYNIRINGKTLNGSSYFMYVLKIPYKETYRHNFQSTLSFIKYIKYNSKGQGHDEKKSIIDYKYLEKTDIQWVSLETIKMSMDPLNEDEVNYPLRHVFKKTLEQNLDDILNFCSSFNDSNIFNIENNDFVKNKEQIYNEEPHKETEISDDEKHTRSNSYKQYYTSNFFRKKNDDSVKQWRKTSHN
jgi:hypothetical protein